MKTLTIIVIISGVLLSGCSTREAPAERNLFPAGEWVDLSHDFAADTIYWPTAEPFKLETVAAGKTDAGYYYSAYQFSAAEHGGTHIDAPVHFAEGRKSVDQIPLDRLIGPALLVSFADDVRAVGAAELKAHDLRGRKRRGEAVKLEPPQLREEQRGRGRQPHEGETARSEGHAHPEE